MFFKKSKEKNINEDLRVIFHRGELKYIPCDEFGNKISEDNLDIMQLDILRQKNEELQENPLLMQKLMHESENSERTEKLRELGFPCSSFEVLSTNRTTKNISPEIKDWLEDLTNKENVLIGIHRTGTATLDQISEMLRGGLIVNSLNGGTTTSSIHLMNTVSYYSNNETIIKEVLCADAYKDSLGSIIVKIPDEELTTNIFMIDSETGTFYLDPEYIVGFMPVGPEGTITEVISYYYSNDPSKPFIKPLTAIYDDRQYAIDKTSTNLKK